jgi:hypothetical protein
MFEPGCVITDTPPRRHKKCEWSFMPACAGSCYPLQSRRQRKTISGETGASAPRSDSGWYDYMGDSLYRKSNHAETLNAGTGSGTELFYTNVVSANTDVRS